MQFFKNSFTLWASLQFCSTFWNTFRTFWVPKSRVQSNFCCQGNLTLYQYQSSKVYCQLHISTKVQKCTVNCTVKPWYIRERNLLWNIQLIETTMDPDWKHLLKAIALLAFGLIIKSYLLNGAGYSIFVHILYILVLILVVYNFLQSYKLPPVADSDFTALIVGAGFSGLGMAVKLQEMGVKFRIIEKAERLGGTWRENVYPGCGCDVPSHLYR